MRILVVDDSRAMRALVMRVLRAAGFQDLTEAGSGAEALDSLRASAAASPFDFVLSDWNMPEMGGLELLRALLAEGPRVPLGFVTSECTDDIRALALSSGARFIVHKPFSPEGLQSALNTALAS
jgi:two-component system chemotaxis response regulator CheY